MSDKLPYEFRLVKLMTIEFAVVEQNFKEDKEVGFKVDLRLNAAGDQKLIAVASRFQFMIDEQPFIIVNVEGQFKVTDNTWSALLQEDTQSLFLPNEFITHLAMLVVGSTRGVLHAKLENTQFNQFLIPTINLKDIIKGGVKMDFTANRPTSIT